MNKVVLTGRITKDLELKKTKKDTPICEFTLATNRIGSEDADFINCIVWSKQAENLVKFQGKGSLIAVFGELRTESYEVNEQKRYKTYVLVSNIEFLSKKETNPFEEFGKSIKTESKVDEQLTITDADIPF